MCLSLYEYMYCCLPCDIRIRGGYHVWCCVSADIQFFVSNAGRLPRSNLGLRWVPSWIVGHPSNNKRTQDKIPKTIYIFFFSKLKTHTFSKIMNEST